MDTTKKLIEALERLLNCPDLYLDSLEQETVDAIDQANKALDQVNTQLIKHSKI